MARKTPMRVWQSSVRRATRDYVRDRGQVPGLCCYASVGANPKKVEIATSLHILQPDGRAIREAIADHLHRHEAVFGGVGKLLGEAFERRLVVALATHGEEPRLLEVSVAQDTGLGAWRVSRMRLQDDLVPTILEALHPA